MSAILVGSLAQRYACGPLRVRSPGTIAPMIDMRVIRENPELVRTSQEKRGEDPGLVDRVLEADAARRAALQEFESLRAEQKQASREIGKASPEDRPAALEAAKKLAAKVKEAEARSNDLGEQFTELAMSLDNVVEADAPAGGADDYVVLRHEGPTPRDFQAEGFEPKDHLDLGEALGAIDVKRGAKVSGSRFYFLSGVGARLELALLSMAVDQATEAGFTLQITPTLVRPEIMRGTGFLGEHSDEVYHLATDDLYLVGTSEVSLAGYHEGEILDLSNGPIRYAGWSTCYRREAGAAGRDTRGIIRVHQFNKVEMFSYCRPDEAEQEHQLLLNMEEEMLRKAELPYRVIDTAAGDLGSSAARKFDCEAWLPTQNRWMELTSTSNCTTFQARRLKVRDRAEDGSTQIAATLNGTLATTRWLVALLENHQQADGSVRIPKALQPYMGGLEVMEPLSVGKSG